MFETYRPRPVSSLGTHACGGWRLKVYGISAHGERPRDDLIEQAKAIADRRLPVRASGPDRYGLGWLIVHEGAVGDYAFVDWWVHQDIAQHHSYGAPRGAGTALRYRWPRGAGFCVWEMAVCWHEREAWVRHVLARADAPDFESYLADRLEGDI